MSRNENTSQLIDSLLSIIALGGVFAVGIAAPNAAIAFEKPLDKFFKHMDKRERKREISRILSNMKSSGLVTGDYQHGLEVSKKGQLRIQQKEFDSITIKNPSKWDGRWRLVFYDIPEKYRSERNSVKSKLQQIGYYQLQRSVWIHPFPSQNEIEIIANHYGVARYISFVEVVSIANQKVLLKRFNLK